MKYLLSMGVVFIWCLSSLAQPNLPPKKADSLWSVWENINQPDTSRLKAMKRISWDGYLFTQPDSAFYFAQLQYEFAKEKGLKKHMADALNTQGASFYFQGDYSKAIGYYYRCLKINEELGDKKEISGILNNIGIVYKYQSNYPKAIDYYSRSLKIREELGDKKGIAGSLNNIGAIHQDQGDYAKAIDLYTQSLKIQEKIGVKQNIAISLNNIGNIYYYQGNYSKAINYYSRSLKIRDKLGNKENIAASLNNIGNIYNVQGDYSKAIDYYTRSLKIREELGHKQDIANSLNNIGMIYADQDDYSKAIDFYTQSLKIREEIGSKKAVASSLINIGVTYKNQGDYVNAENYSSQALSIAQEVDAAIETKNAAITLWEINKGLGRYKDALSMYELYIQTRDSLESEKNQKEVIRQEYKYEYDKQAALDSVAHAKEQKLADATIAQQEAEAEKKDAELEAKRNQQYALFGGVGLLLIFGGFMYNRFRVTRKQKFIIEQQKAEVDQQKSEAEKQRDLAQKEHQEAERQRELVQEKNTEILDSITYAKRLQDAILPPLETVKEHFPSSFILFKPKDIVSGDFYWMETTQTHTFLAAVDCTGHGVPGAMVSVVCANALNKSVNELGKTDPAEILNATRELVIATFAKAGSDVKDGMDISLLSVAHRARLESESGEQSISIRWSGANNPLWIIRKDATEVEEIKADKQPIGLYGDLKPFTSHEVKLNKEDVIYMFSDGYVDQFGGEDITPNKIGGKKFKSKNLKNLLLSIRDQDMDHQKQSLDETFESWKGDLEQVDDVCVIGVRL